jgi:DNA invertase Pin-like site-specific DNA recombinase
LTKPSPSSRTPDGGRLRTQLYTDTVSGSVTDRPGLTQALSHLRAGDTLVVWRLDRLGRSLRI